jgi:LmbE family N-acetylglucosaminyl deacetylase
VAHPGHRIRDPQLFSGGSMRNLPIATPGQKLSVLCLGAHSDDIEIGAGATIIGWIEAGVALDVTWCVLSAPGARADEARASAAAFLRGARNFRVHLGEFKDSYFPYQGDLIKPWLSRLKDEIDPPDVILTHREHDRHQDHREVSGLTWNLFRNHFILEYEIPKWDGDLGQPNVYVPATPAAMDRKIALLLEHFGTQRSKDWFDRELFGGLARLRGMECRAPGGIAEAFYARKLVLDTGAPAP